jgi:hypothetical protein
MSKIEQLRKFEFKRCVIEEVALKKKGSKSCKDPHTKISVLTRELTNEEMDAICYGSVHGFRVKLVIECVEDPEPLIPKPQQTDVTSCQKEKEN